MTIQKYLWDFNTNLTANIAFQSTIYSALPQLEQFISNSF